MLRQPIVLSLSDRVHVFQASRVRRCASTGRTFRCNMGYEFFEGNLSLPQVLTLDVSQRIRRALAWRRSGLLGMCHDHTARDSRESDSVDCDPEP
jgi:hypothetical protein